MATDGGGDGDGVFYLPGGQTMPHKLLQECLDFSENVRNIFLSIDLTGYDLGSLVPEQALP